MIRERLARRPSAGFALIELAVTLTVFLVLLSTFFVFYRTQALALANHEQFVNAKQNAQIGLDFLMRELRTAGSRPAPESFDAGTCGVAAATASVCFGLIGIKGFPRLVAASGTSLRLLADFRGASAGDPPDGCPIQVGEDVTYAYDAASRRLTRRIGNGTPAPVLEGIAPTNGFRLRYYGYGTGSPPAYVEFQSGGGSLTADERARVTHVVLDVTTEARNRVPSLPPIRSTQTSTIHLRNPPC